MNRRERDEAIIAGNEAANFMRNPMLTQGVAAVRDKIFADWVASPPEDAEKRERLFIKWHALEDVLTVLQKPIDKGTIARAQQKKDNFQADLE